MPINHKCNRLDAAKEIEDFLEEEGFLVSHSPPYQPEQNGFAERSVGVIVTIARKLRIQSRLPEVLWPEFGAAAVWILNRVPKRMPDGHWIVPWLEVCRNFSGDTSRPLNLSNLRLYGSLAYCRIRNIPKLQKHGFLLTNESCISRIESNDERPRRSSRPVS